MKSQSNCMVTVVAITVAYTEWEISVLACGAEPELGA